MTAVLKWIRSLTLKDLRLSGACAGFDWFGEGLRLGEDLRLGETLTLCETLVRL